MNIVKTRAELKTRSTRDLASIAKKKKVPGWRAMNKDELVKALAPHLRGEGNGRPRHAAASRRIEAVQAKLAETKDISFRSLEDEDALDKERLVLMVRDPYWLHAYWELNHKSVERAKVALGQYWHGARPVLRVFEVAHNDASSTARRPLRDVDIHGGVNNWYIDVQDPPKSYQLDIGYLGSDGRFFCLARSNVVRTPPMASDDAFDRNWSDVAKDFDRIFALSGGYSDPQASVELKELFEERFQRPIGDLTAFQFGPGAAISCETDADFEFHVDAELIIHGVTQPDATVTLRGEPVKVRSDGTFAVRLNLPDRRQVLPMVATRHDGGQQRTIILAVDRNTKIMGPQSREIAD